LALRADTSASVSSVDNIAGSLETLKARRNCVEEVRAGKEDVCRNAGLVAAAANNLNWRAAAILSDFGGMLWP
jgi:hypothetical protein